MIITLSQRLEQQSTTKCHQGERGYTMLLSPRSLSMIVMERPTLISSRDHTYLVPGLSSLSWQEGCEDGRCNSLSIHAVPTELFQIHPLGYCLASFRSVVN